MEIWLTYSLYDLLIFSPNSYFQLYKLSNQLLWPLHIPLSVLACGMLFFLFKGGLSRRFVLLWLAGVWIFVSYWFIEGYYSQIFTFAHIISLFFYLEALLLFVFAVLPSTSTIQPYIGNIRTFTAWLLIIGGYLVYPLSALLFWEHKLTSIQIFSIAPDPTAIATLGLLTIIQLPRGNLILLIIPLLWVIFSFLTHLAFIG